MEIGTRVTGHITTNGQRVEFTGTVTDTFRTGGRDAVNVMCDDGQERTAPTENLQPEQHVTSVRGGAVHLADADSPIPFPLCPAASRNTYTHYRTTPQPVTCKECAGTLTRRAARLAKKGA
jgi:hypothetical protein